jgi:CRP-like cAMP-binding protein
LRTAGSFNVSVNQLMVPEPAKYAFEAISDCSLLIFPFAAFEALARHYPDMNALYIRVLKENILIIQNRIAEMATKSPEQRYLTLLAQSPELFQGAFNKHIANYLGITAVSLSRIRGRVYNRFSEAD